VNWEAVGTIAEIIAAASVIASLLYLAAQIRQSTKVARAETTKGLMFARTDFFSEYWSKARGEFNAKFANYVDQKIKFVTGDVEK
jgi:hypothetical protein